MKPKQPYSERRDKELKNSMLFTGLFVIAFGIVFIFIGLSTLLDGETASAAVIFLISIGLIIVGILCIKTGYKKVKEHERDENISGTKENRKLMERHDKMIEKYRRTSAKKDMSLKSELRGNRVSAGLIACAVILIFGFILAYMIGYLIILIVSAIVCLPVIIYFSVTSDYDKLKKYAEEKGIDFAAAEEDLRDCDLFSMFGKLIAIGDRYTVFICDKVKIIIENKDVAAIAPSYTLIDNYTNGIYSGTTRQCYILIFLADGQVFKIQLAEFAEELALEAYQKRACYMHDGFSVQYPENTPPYIKASFNT